MRPSHICHACGHDLARLRAEREPHYRFMIVRCPRCATVAVRRRPASPRMRLMLTALALYIPLNATVIAVFCLTCLLFSYFGAELTGAYDELAGAAWFAGAFLLMMAIGIAMSTSLWFAHALSHWRAGHLLGLALAVAVFVSLIPYLWLSLESLWVNTDGWQEGPDGARRPLAEVYAEERREVLQYARALLPHAVIFTMLAAGTVLLYRQLGLDRVTFRRERRQLLRRMRRAGRRAVRA